MANAYPITSSLLEDSLNMDGPAETVESEVEDEVDQLESDSEVDETTNETSAKKNDPAGGQRIPGQSLLPPVRLENIITAEGVTGSLALSKEGLFMLSIATEEFVKKMAEAGHLKAMSERRTTVDYNDMAATTQQYQEFMFLGDTIPVPVSLSEALAMREDKEKGLLDDDPPMSISTPSFKAPIRTAMTPWPTPGFVISNGQPRRNGSSSGSGKRERKREQSKVAEGSRSRAEGSSSGAGSEYHGSVQNGRFSISAPGPSPLANGHSATPSRSGTMTPARDDLGEHPPPLQFLPPPRPSSFAAQEETWATPYAVPTSGFLTGPGGPFGHAAQNPGRTIYSHQHRTES